MDGARGSEDRSAAEQEAEAAWLVRLYELNPWANGLDIESEAFEVARQNACVNRWIEGVDAWNAWAEEMRKSRPTKIHHSVYNELGSSDFSQICFLNGGDFRRYIFPCPTYFNETHFGNTIHSPGDTLFGSASFYGDAWFNKAFFGGITSFHNSTFGGDATFRGCAFHDSAWFANTKFLGHCSFNDVAFGGNGEFDGTKFDSGVEFDNSTFHGDASFEVARFNDDAYFDDAVFNCDVWLDGSRFVKSSRFDGAIFRRRAFFKGVTFSHASFALANFFGSVTFQGAKFDTASFRSIKSERSFSLNSTFCSTPDFREASFHEAPQLDDAEIASCFSRWTVEDDRRPVLIDWAKHAPNRDEHAKFRALRGMADQGNDHTSALRFNADEIAARRFWVDEPFGRNASRFWLGWLYQLTSDYGRSIFRPLIGLFAVVATFAALFYAAAQSDDPKTSWTRACHESVDRAELKLQPTDKLTEAISLSIRNALIFDRSDTSRRTYGCLYGLVDNGRSGAIPTWVGKLSLLESLLSAIFLFLIGLALRNMFRLG
jgi:uncharacterized protein YjbI with pentapeptide repeats